MSFFGFLPCSLILWLPSHLLPPCKFVCFWKIYLCWEDEHDVLQPEKGSPPHVSTFRAVPPRLPIHPFPNRDSLQSVISLVLGWAVLAPRSQQGDDQAGRGWHITVVLPLCPCVPQLFWGHLRWFPWGLLVQAVPSPAHETCCAGYHCCTSMGRGLWGFLLILYRKMLFASVIERVALESVSRSLCCRWIVFHLFQSI